MYPWEQPGWPDLVWSDAALSGLLARASREHGRLLGKMETLDFELRDVEGVVEMMLDATQKHAQPLTEDRLLA